MILTFFETKNGLIKKSSLILADYCKRLKNKFNLNIIGIVSNEINETEEEKLKFFEISKLYKIQEKNAIANCIADIAKKENSQIIILSHTYESKYILPILSSKLDYTCVSNTIEIPKNISPFEIKRNAFSGKAFENTEIKEEKVIISVNTNSYSSSDNENKSEFTLVDHNESYENNKQFEITNLEKQSSKINLRDAEVVVSGGRGLKGPENWKMIEELASILNAATACSKPVSDLNWRPHEEHVGQTGKTISPELYIAIGISGAIQHAAGVSSSKYILSINTDKEAPIFKISDYGIVGDAFEVVPKIIEELKK